VAGGAVRATRSAPRARSTARGPALAATASASAPLAVVDIGSNSGRMIVVSAGAGGHLEILADARFPLRLVHESAAGGGRLGDAAATRVVEALTAFRAVATAAGASGLVAVATAAVREASNGVEWVRRVAASSGVEVEVLDGDAEARLAFAGAVHGLPAGSGLVVDIGGGSVEVCRFRERRPLRQWTLPLGALLLSERFLTGDPPRGAEIARLRQHALATIAGAGVTPLRPGEVLVGTGGTLRNLAKVDRARRPYPISRLHGYRLNGADLDRAVALLAGRPLGRRRRVPGLSADRADSIVGGGLCAQALFDHLGAEELLLSGRGLREGVALERLGLPVRTAAEVRGSSVEALARRFGTWDEGRARLRSHLAGALISRLDPEAGDAAGEILRHAAVLVDIGRSVDYYSRWEHAARIAADSDLYGFSHREIVLISAALEKAGTERVTLPGYRSLLSAADAAQLDRLAVVLALADQLGHRLRSDGGVRVLLRRGGATVSLPADVGPLGTEMERRFWRCFDRRLRLAVG
jgi:exopolyphosphatase/guanosine-5'-triphosphate,3'-diphosphate pyrophosphatase